MSCSTQTKYILTLLIFLLSVWNPLVISIGLSQKHEQWMRQHDRIYKDAAEKDKRFQIFKENLEFVESFNAAGDTTFHLSIDNQFADQTNVEFKSNLLNGLKKPLIGHGVETMFFKYENATDVPATMDWIQRGAVTPIKNQQSCGSCWAFTAVGATEGIHQITTGKLVSLSEQELVDCVKGYSHGCNGGYVEGAYELIVQNGGISSESEYPYVGVENICNVNKGASYSTVQIKGYEKVPANDEKSLLKAVANQPVAVYIEAGERDFQLYSSGIFAGKCGTDIDHTVTVVGYGISDDGVNYWLVKNSWGTSWGENGYMKMKRDITAKEGLCGLAMFPTYPIA